jgi:hypothetical protein
MEVDDGEGTFQLHILIFKFIPNKQKTGKQTTNHNHPNYQING